MNIKEIRTLKKLSLRALAKKSGLTAAYISQLENGIKVNPTRQTLEKLAKALGVAASELLNDF